MTALMGQRKASTGIVRDGHHYIFTPVE
jgi:hypothetical protein